MRQKHTKKTKTITSIQYSHPFQIIDCCSSEATIDGGDVLFTGREFFVGLSTRTNAEGVSALQDAFPEYPVHGISVDAGLHLKTLSSVAAEDVIIIGTSAASKSAKKQIQVEKVLNFSLSLQVSKSLSFT